MPIYSNTTLNYYEDPAKYYGFEKYEHLFPNVDLFFGASQNSKINEPSENIKILFATEEQINELDSSYVVGGMNSYETQVDEILSISPLCHMRSVPSKRQFVFQPFNPELEPEDKTKHWDVIYTGYATLGHTGHIIDTISKFNHRFVSFSHPNSTNTNVSYKEKLQLIANSKIDIVHNMVADVIPQLKTRAFEAAFCKSLIICLYDKYKTLEKWFTPYEDFIYYHNYEDLESTIQTILNNYNEYQFMIENAYNKAHKEYTTEQFVKKYLIK
jgi:hypothetical protein